MRARLLGMCVGAKGALNLANLAALKTVVTVSDFLDIEELAVCESDRASAFEKYITEHPDILRGVQGVAPGSE
ncbi:MAG: hypothetical protein B7733_05875 [Myxococcales bacterium FL481]|nr:MAG: hypothetical protein B7733_05875 [Myxococcales bacterium FL481]